MAVEIHPKFIVDEGGKPVAVQLSVAEFEALCSEREDLMDIKALKRAVKNGGKFVTLRELGKRLGLEK